MIDYQRPQSLQQALAELAYGPARLLAGGTDVFPGSGPSLTGRVLDLTAIAELRGIAHRADGLRIGATTTWAEIAKADLPPALRGLQQAARQVGSAQVQNMGTIGGNLCNASPAADGVPPLLTLDARVELVGPKGTRILALSDFLLGPRKTARQAEEILAAIHLPHAAMAGQSAFSKLGARAYLVISIAMVAARIVLDGQKIATASVAVGACSATAQRLSAVEAALLGRTTDNWAQAIAPDDIRASLSPIDDIRATADYRHEAGAALVLRTLQTAIVGAQS